MLGTPEVDPQFQPAAPRVGVLLTTAPHRRASLGQCLEALARQSRPPDDVLLVFDGLEGDSMVSWPDNSELCVRIKLHVRTEGRGAGARWRHPHLGAYGPRDIVLTLDDDFAPDPDYVGRTVAALERHDCAVTWHGWGPDAEPSAYTHEPTMDQRVVAVGAGCAAFRWGWVGHLAEPVRLVRDVFLTGAAADDDAWLALDLWLRGVHVIRPRGAAPLRELEASRAATAGHVQHGAHRIGQRWALRFLTGCPLYPCNGVPGETDISRRASAEAASVLWRLAIERSIVAPDRAFGRQLCARVGVPPVAVDILLRGADAHLVLPRRGRMDDLPAAARVLLFLADCAGVQAQWKGDTDVAEVCAGLDVVTHPLGDVTP